MRVLEGCAGGEKHPHPFGFAQGRPAAAEAAGGRPLPEGYKQDCELKGAYRLLPRLKDQFPQLPLRLLLDSS